jgi:hypothetical protein
LPWPAAKLYFSTDYSSLTQQLSVGKKLKSVFPGTRKNHTLQIHRHSHHLLDILELYNTLLLEYHMIIFLAIDQSDLCFRLTVTIRKLEEKNNLTVPGREFRCIDILNNIDYARRPCDPIEYHPAANDR